LSFFCGGQALEMVSLLLHTGADARVRDGLGKLPLGLSARRGQVEVVAMLLPYVGREGIDELDRASRVR
jgi:ankyrin repeat protein